MQVKMSLADFQKTSGFMDVQVLEQTTKFNGGRNWNHYLFVKNNTHVAREAVKFRLTHPKLWMKMALSHYFRWTQPSFVTPYRRHVRGPDHSLYLATASMLQDTFFYDLRPILKKVDPQIHHEVKSWLIEQNNEKIALSIFGILLFPVFLLCSAYLLYTKYAQGDQQTLAVLLPPFLTILWVLVIPCFTDGYEGNRMRFAISPYIILFLIAILDQGLVKKLKSPSRQLGPAPDLDVEALHRSRL